MIRADEAGAGVTGYPAEAVRLLAVYLPALAVMTLFRLIFVGRYGEPGLWGRQPADLLHAFFLGLRYDLSTVSYIQIVPVLTLTLLFLTGRSHWYRAIRQRALPGYYAAVFSILGLLQVIDHFYYEYFQDHINVLFFGFLEHDTGALVRTIWANYPIVWVIVALSLVAWLIFRGCVRLVGRDRRRWRWLDRLRSRPVAFALLLVLPAGTALSARGSIGLFPLEARDAIISDHVFINKVGPNSVVMLSKAVQDQNRMTRGRVDHVERFQYAGDPAGAYRDMTGAPPRTDGDLWEVIGRTSLEQEHRTPPHVVLVIMEGLGGYWLRFHSETFDLLGELGRHLEEDYLFPNFVAASGGTMGSMSAAVTGLPNLPGWPLPSERELLTVSLRTTIVQPFEDQGYETRFVYGGKVGWRHLYDHVRVQGFDAIDGSDRITAAMAGGARRGSKHSWGIFDEVLFDYIHGLLERAVAPQFLLVLTTSNHPPYDLPPGYAPGLQVPPPELSSRLIGNRELAAARLRTYRYANDCLGRFISRLKDGPLGRRTIVAATGDHGINLVNFATEEQFERFTVPLYVYVPERHRPEHFDPSAVGGYLDLLPTLAELSLSGAEYCTLGQNLFEPGVRGRATIHQWFFTPDGAVDEQGRCYAWEGGEPGRLVLTPEGVGMTGPGSAPARQRQGLYALTQMVLAAEETRAREERAGVEQDSPEGGG